jgi:kynurenine 3-monooxygenase
MRTDRVTILGAGLVGSLLSIFLSRKGYKVTIYEGRSDMRKAGAEGGRSINLALSRRGLKALDAVGLAGVVQSICIPMHGRMIHDLEGNQELQPYGKEGEFINSVSRSGLNMILMDAAEEAGVSIQFEQRCEHVDFDNGIADFGDISVESDWIFGADGAFSALRNSYLKTPLFNYSQNYISAGYKELCIPPTSDGKFAIEPHALHIWPRGDYMLIALPNLDKSFTCTLFYPMKGERSFEQLKDEEAVRDLFLHSFPDTLEIMPSLEKDFFTNPTSGLVTVRCSPWVKGRTALIGDAAHAIVPFYGQGMNAGFEDCFVFNQLLEQHNGLSKEVLSHYDTYRKPDADAIADLALYNFVEMRDKVADPKFILQKKIEKKLNMLFPKRWIPLYSMVTFSDFRYSEALEMGLKQQQIMDEILAQEGIEQNWESLDFEELVQRL